MIAEEKRWLMVAALRCAEAGDKLGEAEACTELRHAHDELNQFGKAIEYHTKVLNLYLELGHREGEGFACNNLANTYRRLVQFAKALELYTKSLAIRELGDKQREGNAYLDMGS